MRRVGSHVPHPPKSPARRSTTPRPGPDRDLLVASALAWLVFLPHLPMAWVEHITPDAAGYLDMGRNLFTGRGAVSTYNLYQFWPGTQHPMLPYMQPLYPVVCGLLWMLDGLRAVISFNILLLGVNCALVYFLIRRVTGRPAAFLTGALLGFAPNLLLTAIHPWTEQLHLFTLLVAVLLFRNERVPRFWVGALLGISCLVRFAGVYNVAAVLAAVFVLHGFGRRAFGEFAKMLAGLLAIAIPYESFCLLRYGALYPEYLAAAKQYTSAVASGGAVYRDSLPALAVPAAPALAPGLVFSRVLSHMTELVKACGPAAVLALAAALGLILRGERRREPDLAVFACLGVFSILAYAVSLVWLPAIEAARYSVVPFVTLVPAGVAVIRGEVARRLKPSAWTLWWGTVAVFAILFALTIPAYAKFRNWYDEGYPRSLENYWSARADMHAWIRANAPKDALVASEFLKDPIFFERPFVALPSGKALEPKAMDSYLAAFAPDYILYANPKTAQYMMTRSDYRMAHRNALLGLLERIPAEAR